MTDAIVFAACCVIGVFALGLEIGKQHQPLLCPVAPGQQIAATIAPDTCVYVQNITGRSLRKIKAVKS